MVAMDDGQLIREYARDARGGSSRAFDELVKRHVGMVYSAAVREAGDEHLAEDVTQAVFLVLMQKAGRLRLSGSLGGWLFAATRYAAATARDKEQRRKGHEERAGKMMMRPEMRQEQIEEVWSEVEPKLNAALARLASKDREAVILRYLEERSIKQVAEALGVSEAAAKMRIGRGLEKLRGFLGGEAGMPSVAVLAMVLEAKATVAVPAGLAGSVTAAVLSGAAGTTGKAMIIAKGAMNMMMWAKIKIVAAVAAIVLFGSTIGVVILSRTVAADELAHTQPATRPVGINILNVSFDPLISGKNAVHLKVQNPSATQRVLAVYIQTRSPQPGGRGRGWGSAYFCDVDAGATAEFRLALKIFEPLSDASTIRLRFDTLASSDQYDPLAPVQDERNYSAKLLAKRPKPPATLPAAPEDQARAVRDVFGLLQSHLKDARYAEAVALFTEDYCNTELNHPTSKTAAQWLKDLLDDGVGLWFFWDKSELLRLTATQVLLDGSLLRLTANLDEQSWEIVFAREAGQWKIDAISGFKPASADWVNWRQRLLPKMIKRQTAHLEIYCFPGSTAEKHLDQIARQREEGLAAIVDFLGSQSPEPIQLVFFEDRQTKRKETGHQGDGWATGQTIVEVYNDQTQLDPFHEATHIVARKLGNPPALLNEGLAVCMSQRLGAQALKDLGGSTATLDGRCRQLLQQGEWIELPLLLTYTEIGSKESRPPVSYALAGGFVNFLVDRYGKERFLEAYQTLKSTDDRAIRQANAQAMQRIYGRSVVELEHEWTEVLRLDGIATHPAVTQPAKDTAP